jgi:hypothetical protein
MFAFPTSPAFVVPRFVYADVAIQLALVSAKADVKLTTQYPVVVYVIELTLKDARIVVFGEVCPLKFTQARHSVPICVLFPSLNCGGVPVVLDCTTSAKRFPYGMLFPK